MTIYNRTMLCKLSSLKSENLFMVTLFSYYWFGGNWAKQGKLESNGGQRAGAEHQAASHKGAKRQITAHDCAGWQLAAWDGVVGFLWCGPPFWLSDVVLTWAFRRAGFSPISELGIFWALGFGKIWAQQVSNVIIKILLTYFFILVNQLNDLILNSIKSFK